MFWYLIGALVVLGFLSFLASHAAAQKEKSYVPPQVKVNPLYNFADQLHNAGMTFKPIDRIMKTPISERFKLPEVNMLDNGDVELVYPDTLGPNTFGADISRDTVQMASSILSQALRRNVRTVEQVDERTYLLKESSVEVEYGYEALCNKTKLTQSVEVQGIKQSVSAKITEEENGDVTIDTTGLSVGRSHIESQMEIFMAEFDRFFKGVESLGSKTYVLRCVSEEDYNKIKNWEALCKRNKLFQVRDKNNVLPSFEDEGEHDDRTITINTNGIQIDDVTLNDAMNDLVVYFEIGISGFKRRGGDIKLVLVGEEEYRKLQKERSLARAMKLQGENGEYPTFAEDLKTKDIILYTPDSCVATEDYLNGDRVLSAFSSIFERPIARIKSHKDENGINYFRCIFAPPHELVVPKGSIADSYEVWNEKIVKILRKQKLTDGESELIPLGQVLDPVYRKTSFITAPIDTNIGLGTFGQSSSGKTKTALSLIATMAAAYPHNMYFFADGKGAADWDRFAEVFSTRPVAKLAKGGDSLVELANIVIDIFTVYKERQRLFSEHKCSNITSYRQKTGKLLPRIFFILEEFSLFKDNSPVKWDNLAAVNGSIAFMLQEISKAGRSYGFHLHFLGQRYQGDQIPTPLRTNISVLQIHKMNSKDAAFSGLEDELDEVDKLSAGQYFATAEGITDPVSGVSRVKCCLPFIGEDRDIEALIESIGCKPKVHTPFDHEIPYARESADALEKLPRLDQFRLVTTNIFKGQGLELEQMNDGGDPASVIVAGVTKINGQKIGISFVDGSYLTDACNDYFTEIEEAVAELGLRGVLLFVDGKVGKGVPEVAAYYPTYMINKVSYCQALNKTDKSRIASTWATKLEKRIANIGMMDSESADEEMESEGRTDKPDYSIKPKAPSVVKAQITQELKPKDEKKRGRPSIERKKEGDHLECLSCKKMLHKSNFLGESGKGAPKTTCKECRNV